MRGRMVEAGARGRGRRGAGRDGKRVGVGGAGTHESRGRIASAEMVRMAPAANPGRMLERKPEAATERVAMVARGATCVVADRSWRASLVQSARTPVSVGSVAPRASGSGKMRERARKRFEDVAMSMGARARTRRIRRAPRAPSATPGACHDGSNTARSCQLAHLRPGGGGRRADRRAGGHRQAAEQPLSRAGGAKDRHREPKVASRVRVARSVMTRARNRATLTRGYSGRGGRHARGKSYRHRRHPISRPRPDP